MPEFSFKDAEDYFWKPVLKKKRVWKPTLLMVFNVKGRKTTMQYERKTPRRYRIVTEGQIQKRDKIWCGDGWVTVNENTVGEIVGMVPWDIIGHVVRKIGR